MPGLLDPSDSSTLTPQQRLMMQLVGAPPGTTSPDWQTQQWTAQQQNAQPGAVRNMMSGLPTAQGVGMAAMGMAPQGMGLLDAAMAAGRGMDARVYGNADPSKTALATGAGFPSFQDPRLVADSLATAAQNGVPGADDAFRRYLFGGGGGGGGGWGSWGGGSGGMGGNVGGGQSAQGSHETGTTSMDAELAAGAAGGGAMGGGHEDENAMGGMY